MLARIVFPYKISYIPPRCRSTVTKPFLSETSVDLREAAVCEAPVVFRIEPPPDCVVHAGPPGAMKAFPAPPMEIVGYAGRLYWPAMDDEGLAAVSAAEWIASSGLPPRADGKLPDLLGLARAVEFNAPSGPASAPFDPAAARKIVEDRHDAALASVHRRAAGILLRGGRIFVERPEPVWIVDCRIRNFGSPQEIGLRVCPMPGEWRDCTGERTAFLDYEAFRIDRRADAEEFCRLRTENSRDHVRAGDATVTGSGLHAPSVDPLTPALRALALAVDAFAVREAGLVRRGSAAAGILEHVPESAADAAHLLSSSHHHYARRLAGFRLPDEDAPWSVYAEEFERLAAALDGADWDEEPFGYFGSLTLAVGRAVARSAADFAAGLLPAPVLSGPDDAAIAAIAF